MKTSQRWRRLTARVVAFALPVAVGVIMSAPATMTAQAAQDDQVSNYSYSVAHKARTLGRAWS
jgi:hypothetical protein